MADNRSAVCELHNLSLRHGGNTVLSGVNLRITPGEVVALVGESGCGKSTLLSHLRALVAGQVAWCPQLPGLVPVRSAFHNIYAGTLDQHSLLYNLRQLVRPSTTEWQRVLDVAEPLGIGGLLPKSLDQLSGGERQRVNIARACIQKRSIFFGDEPVSALDEFQGERVLKMIIERHHTCLLVLHDMDLALSCCDRVIGIANGKIVVDSPAKELKAATLASIFHNHPVEVAQDPQPRRFGRPDLSC